jgi:hypothetical protein
MNEISLAARIIELIHEHDGVRGVERATGIDAAYLIRLREGKKTNPGPDVLKKLGLEQVITYRRAAASIGKAGGEG